MARYWQAGSAMVVAAVLAGCGTNRMLDVMPDLPRDIGRTGAGTAEDEARSQMPDGGSPYHAKLLPPSQMLGSAPERSPEVAGVPSAARIRATVNGIAI